MVLTLAIQWWLLTNAAELHSTKGHCPEVESQMY